MGIFDKLAFWKKKDDFDLGKDFGADLGLGPNDNFGGPDLGLPPQGRGPGRDLGLPSRNLGMPDDTGFGNMGQGFQQAPPGRPAPMQQPFGAPVQPSVTERDYASNDKFEVVSAKLDAIRYTLDSINQRLRSLERVAYGEHEDNKKRW